MSEKQGTYQKPQTIFRTIKNEDHPFVMIDRRPIENPNLSWGAKGVLAYLLSRPNNWRVRLRDLVNKSTDGAGKVRLYIRELVQAGHAKRVPVKDPKTQRIVEWTLEVYELPFTEKATPPVSIGVAFHEVENRTLNKNESINNIKNGDKSPNLSELPIEWQVAGRAEKIVLRDDLLDRQLDFANLVAMYTANQITAREIAMAFQTARGIALPESKIKGQRRAIKEMLEMGVNGSHVTRATHQLMEAEMTVVDLFSVSKTSIDLANKPQEKTRLL